MWVLKISQNDYTRNCRQDDGVSLKRTKLQILSPVVRGQKKGTHKN